MLKPEFFGEFYAWQNNSLFSYGKKIQKKVEKKAFLRMQISLRILVFSNSKDYSIIKVK